jgi:hypothetical protein
MSIDNELPHVTGMFQTSCCTMRPVNFSYLNFFKFGILLGLCGV